MTNIYGKFINTKLLPSLNQFFTEYAARTTVKQQTIGQFTFSYDTEETLLHLRIKSIEKLEALNVTNFADVVDGSWSEFVLWNSSYASWNITDVMNLYLREEELNLYRDVMIPLQGKNLTKRSL
jgi:hypothetical protein